jgi:septal ring factor EnvC (AmiA/AmiB activator)
MRHRCSLLLAFLLGAAPLLSSCRVITPDTVHTERESEREQRIDSLLKDYDRKITALSSKIDASGSANEDVRRSLDDLKKKQQEATRKLEDLRNAPNRSWKDVNAELQIILDELKKAFDRTREQAR